MQIKTFRAGSMHEALFLVRQSLGPDAAVLQAREVGAGVLAWLKGERQVEVVASADVAVPSRLPEAAGCGRAADLAADAPPPAAAGGRAAGITQLQEDFRDRFLRAAEDDFGAFPSLVEGLAGARPGSVDPSLPSPLERARRDLRDRDLSPAVVDALLAPLRHTLPRDPWLPPEQIRDAIFQAVAAMLRTRGPIRLTPARRRIVALVGPTGVGKTSTIAKLAAAFRLQQQTEVGLITLDTCRVAAADQLRTYAEILDVPIEIAASPDQLQAALERLAAAQLVLVDTAGCSPCDRAGLQLLQALLAEAAVDEVQIVLSLVASRVSLQSAWDAFAGLEPAALLLTKLDEAPRLGEILELQRHCGLPISYVTDGQRVPEDIRAADPQWLTRRILDAGAVPLVSESAPGAIP